MDLDFTSVNIDTLGRTWCRVLKNKLDGVHLHVSLCIHCWSCKYNAVWQILYTCLHGIYGWLYNFVYVAVIYIYFATSWTKGIALVYSQWRKNVEEICFYIILPACLQSIVNIKYNSITCTCMCMSRVLHLLANVVTETWIPICLCVSICLRQHRCFNARCARACACMSVCVFCM